MHNNFLQAALVTATIVISTATHAVSLVHTTSHTPGSNRGSPASTTGGDNAKDLQKLTAFNNPLMDDY